MRHAALPRPRAPAPCAEQRGIRLEGSARELKTYTEQSREYRRTVYGHDSWVKHRESTRFLRNLQTTLESGVARSLYTEIAVVTLVSIFIVFVNCLITGYDDLAGEHYAAVFQIPLVKSLSLPALPFNFAMGALSLLLVFRTNTAYSRWNEARTLWGGIVNTCRNLGRQANAYFPQDATGQKLRAQLASQVAMFPKALRSFLRGADDDDKTLLQAIELLGTDSAKAFMQSKNRPTFICNMIAATFVRANLEPRERFVMDQNVNALVDYLGACERIFRSPIPLVYTRHTGRFITSFMVLVPLAMWEPMRGTWNHWATIPASAALAVFLFGIEELGIQIEEPFGILPLEALCDGAIESVVADMKASCDKQHFGPLA